MALKIRNHPSKQVLLAYAENVVDKTSAIDRSMASHIMACAQCKAEVAAIQASLSFVVSAPELDPSSEMTARILMAGKTTRSEMRQGLTPLRVVWKVAQAGACAAAMVVVAGLTFSAFLGSSEQQATAPVFEHSVPTIATQGRSPEAVRQAAVEVAAEVRSLSAAVADKERLEPSPEALGELRAVQSRDADIAAAVSALERNPNSVRATHVVHATLKRQAESLRNIYVEGGSL
tara:strand:- start:320 stop:1018 length:699 start_codon:yes stop_codon:yes gene_type:complete